MQEEHIIEIVKTVLEFVSSLLWPAVIFFVVFYFRKQLVELIGNIRNVKYPGGEVTIQRPDPEASKPEKETATQEKFVDPRGFYTRLGLTHLINESGLVEHEEKAISALLLFETSMQHTWLFVTNKQLFCILDDEETRTSGRLIQWRMPLDEATPIRVRTSTRGNPVVYIDEKPGWLYSRRLHPDEKELEKDIRKLIDIGKN